MSYRFRLSCVSSNYLVLILFLASVLVHCLITTGSNFGVIVCAFSVGQHCSLCTCHRSTRKQYYLKLMIVCEHVPDSCSSPQWLYSPGLFIYVTLIKFMQFPSMMCSIIHVKVCSRGHIILYSYLYVLVDNIKHQGSQSNGMYLKGIVSL